MQPGSRLQLNPYYLGYKILADIKSRWDATRAAGESSQDGFAKLFEVRATENDISFLSNYLTKELAVKLNLFSYGYADEEDAEEHDIQIKSRDYDDVIRALLAPHYNYGAPKIVVTQVHQGELHLQHEKGSLGDLDTRYTEKTLGYIFELWKNLVMLETWQDKTPVKFAYSPSGFKQVK